MKNKPLVTVGELIGELQKLNPNATIGVKAGCCMHLHAISRIREPMHNEYQEADYAIDANGDSPRDS